MDASAMIDRMIVNPVQGILSMSDTLQLTPEQVERLRAVSDTLQSFQTQLADSVRQQIASAGAGGNPAALFQTLAPRLQEARARVTEALREAEEIMTPEQWERVPEELRTVRQIQRGGQRGTTPRGPR
jgi:hypothetical protein